jgi:hypothetical protein
MSGLVWLASYPKSGNTWMRMLLSAYQHPRHGGLQLTDAFQATVSESRRTLYEQLAGRIDLTPAEIDQLRQDVQVEISRTITPPVLIKTHNARIEHEGVPLIRDELTLGCVYLIRNPLDIVDSFADHLGQSIDQTIVHMNDPNYSVCGQPNSPLVAQYLDTWSRHVLSWTSQTAFPVHVVRYEDLLATTEHTLRNVLTFLGWPHDDEKIAYALAETAFENLRKQEAEKGFAEVSDQSTGGRFFRRGTAGTWSELLSEKQVADVLRAHGDTMRRYGYSTE